MSLAQDLVAVEVALEEAVVAGHMEPQGPMDRMVVEVEMVEMVDLLRVVGSLAPSVSLALRGLPTAMQTLPPAMVPTSILAQAVGVALEEEAVEVPTGSMEVCSPMEGMEATVALVATAVGSLRSLPGRSQTQGRYLQTDKMGLPVLLVPRALRLPATVEAEVEAVPEAEVEAELVVQFGSQEQLSPTARRVAMEAVPLHQRVEAQEAPVGRGLSFKMVAVEVEQGLPAGAEVRRTAVVRETPRLPEPLSATVAQVETAESLHSIPQ